MHPDVMFDQSDPGCAHLSGLDGGAEVCIRSGSQHLDCSLTAWDVLNESDWDIVARENLSNPIIPRPFQPLQWGASPSKLPWLQSRAREMRGFAPGDHVSISILYLCVWFVGNEMGVDRKACSGLNSWGPGSGVQPCACCAFHLHDGGLSWDVDIRLNIWKLQAQASDIPAAQIEVKWGDLQSLAWCIFLCAGGHKRPAGHPFAWHSVLAATVSVVKPHSCFKLRRGRIQVQEVETEHCQVMWRTLENWRTRINSSTVLSGTGCPDQDGWHQVSQNTTGLVLWRPQFLVMQLSPIRRKLCFHSRCAKPRHD